MVSVVYVVLVVCLGCLGRPRLFTLSTPILCRLSTLSRFVQFLEVVYLLGVCFVMVHSGAFFLKPTIAGLFPSLHILHFFCEQRPW